MGPNEPYTMCRTVGGLYLTVADSLAPLPINNNNKNIFQAISNGRKQKMSSNKKRQKPRKFSARFLAFSTVQKIVLSSSRGQGNFRGLECLRPRPRT